LSVDGTHCQIEEPKHPTASINKTYYSHKSNSAALNYELGVSIYESKLVWINGPYPAGTSDINVYRKENGLKSKIPPNKKVLGDEGYRGDPTVSRYNPYDPKDVKKFKSRARARHETYNRRIKIFRILSDRFRHPLDKHKASFEAICVIVQYQLENGSPLYDV
jgi:DDE superfamily endonuclease